MIRLTWFSAIQLPVSIGLDGYSSRYYLPANLALSLDGYVAWRT